MYFIRKNAQPHTPRGAFQRWRKSTLFLLDFSYVMLCYVCALIDSVTQCKIIYYLIFLVLMNSITLYHIVDIWFVCNWVKWHFIYIYYLRLPDITLPVPACRSTVIFNGHHKLTTAMETAGCFVLIGWPLKITVERQPETFSVMRS